MQSMQNLQAKPTKPNLPNQTYQTKPTEPNLLVKAVNAWVRSAFGNVCLLHPREGARACIYWDYNQIQSSCNIAKKHMLRSGRRCLYWISDSPTFMFHVNAGSKLGKCLLKRVHLWMAGWIVVAGLDVRERCHSEWQWLRICQNTESG